MHAYIHNLKTKSSVWITVQTLSTTCTKQIDKQIYIRETTEFAPTNPLPSLQIALGSFLQEKVSLSVVPSHGYHPFRLHSFRSTMRLLAGFSEATQPRSPSVGILQALAHAWWADELHSLCWNFQLPVRKPFNQRCTSCGKKRWEGL